MKFAWKEVRKAPKNKTQRASVYANRKRAYYEFRVGQDRLISKRRHYRCKHGDPGGALAPKAMGPFTIVEKRAQNCYRLEIPAHIRGRAYPVFYSSDLIPYESRILDPIGMLPDGREDEVLDG